MFGDVVLKSPDVLAQFGEVSVLVVAKRCKITSASYLEFVH